MASADFCLPYQDGDTQPLLGINTPYLYGVSGSVIKFDLVFGTITIPRNRKTHSVVEWDLRLIPPVILPVIL
jgi:hypothetical protein